VIKSDGSERKNYECLKCQDMKVIVYRVHNDTKWVEVEGFSTLVPEAKVLESDFFLGKICTPAQAWEWRSTYSERCECAKQDRMNNLLKSSEITDEFKRLGFQNFATDGKPQVIQDAYNCSLTYFKEFQTICSNRKNSIALLGQPGAGKTHLLMAISNNLMKKLSVSVMYFPFVEGCDDLRSDFNALDAKLERMKKVDVLFIDDLFKPINGEPRASSFEIGKLYAVINYRFLNHKPILVSSELTVDELVDIDEALGTRIYQMCRDFIVLIKGDRKVLNHRLVGA